MGKKILFSIAASIAIFSACNKKSDEPVNTGVVNTAFTYKISSYKSNGLQYGQLFDGQTFTFGNNDAFLVNKGGLITQGNWRNTSDSIIIKSFTSAPLNLLNQNWSKVFISEIGVELKREEGVNLYEVKFDKM